MLFRKYLISGPGHLLNISCLWVVILHVPRAPTSSPSPLCWRVIFHGPFCSQACLKSSDRSLPGSPGLRRWTDTGFVMAKVSSTAPAKLKQSGHSLDEILFTWINLQPSVSATDSAHTSSVFPSSCCLTDSRHPSLILGLFLFPPSVRSSFKTNYKEN